MAVEIRIFLLAAVILYFMEIIHLLKKKRLNLKYSLLWLAVGVLMILFIIFPEIISAFSNLLHFQSSMNALYILLIGFLVIICVALTSIVSNQNRHIKRLTQNAALLEERIRRIERLECIHMSDCNTDAQFGENLDETFKNE
ncbi:MAG: DUF2304 domain-containing protein [Lachnospiraceae bacterium]|nr:DUF2304 domain-containing protein [Lachnospiraceae bacterium]